MFALKHGVIIVCVFPALHCNCFFFKLHFHPFQMKLTRAKKEHYYTVTLTFELNLDNIVLIQHAKYLDQRLLHLKVIQKFKSYWPYSQTVTHILPIALPGPLITEVIGKTACLCVFLAKFFSFCVFLCLLHYYRLHNYSVHLFRVYNSSNIFYRFTWCSVHDFT